MQLKLISLIITRKRNRPNQPNFILNDETISESQNPTHLGVTINNKLSWSVHINMAIAKADIRLSVIRRWRNQIPRPCRETLYKTIIRPVLDYGDIIYDSCLKSESELLEKFQRKCALVCSGAFEITSNEKLLEKIGWSKLESRRPMHRLTLFFTKLKILSHRLTYSKHVDLFPTTQIIIGFVEIIRFWRMSCIVCIFKLYL